MIRYSVARLAIIAFSLLASARVLADIDRIEELGTLINDTLIGSDIPSIAVAVAQDGQILWEEGFGLADIENQLLADEHTSYSLASISKVFTGVALMTLVEEGKVALEDPVNQHLGPTKLTAHIGDVDDATLRRVANHTAGLPIYYQFFYEDEDRQRPSMEESIARYGRIVAKPGETYQYANFGYGILEYVIERSTDQNFADYLQQAIFIPLGMQDSFMPVSGNFKSKVAKRYSHDDYVIPFYDFDHRGGSAVYSSAHDLVRFGMFLLAAKSVDGGNDVLSQASLDQMFEMTSGTDETPNHYGIGVSRFLELEKAMEGIEAFGHSGGMGGVATSLVLLPQQKVSIAVLINKSGPGISRVKTDLLLEVIDRVLPDTVKPASSPAITDLTLKFIERVLPDVLKPTRSLALDERFAGTWTGHVDTYAGQIPLRLYLSDSKTHSGSIGDHPIGGVTVAQGDDDFYYFTLDSGAIDTPDAKRYPHTVKLKLKLRESGALNGYATASSRKMQGRIGNAQSYWAELQKIVTRGSETEAGNEVRSE
ncbi:MAG: serine hydrolase domain-containing protein [Pseudomonadota bacterium]